MRRLTFLLICLPFIMNLFAGDKELAEEVYNKAKEEYTQGLTKKGSDAIALFEKAQKGFEICQNLCKKTHIKEFDIEELKRCISECKNAINLKRQQEKDELEAARRDSVQRAEDAIKRAKEARDSAQRAAEARDSALHAEEELEAQRQKLIEDNLVFVSSDAHLFDENIDLNSGVKRALSDAGFEQTDDPKKARWTVFITAMAYEDKEESITTSKGPEKIYLSNVNVLVKIEDNVEDKLIFEGDIPNNLRYFETSYKDSAQKAYKKLKQELSPIIVNKLTSINP